MYNVPHDTKVVLANDYTEPVDLTAARKACRLSDDQTYDDTFITSLIPVAREMIENWTGLSLVKKTITAILSNPRGNYELPFGPVTGNIVVTDVNGDTVTDPTIRGLDFKILISRGCWWTLVYPAGYTSATIPKGLRQSILEAIVDMYEHRGDEVTTDQNFFSARAFATAKVYSRIPLVQ